MSGQSVSRVGGAEVAHAATQLTAHIGRLCATLCNGSLPGVSARRPAFWLSTVGNSAVRWRGPVLTDAIARHCVTLGANLSGFDRSQSGVAALVSFLTVVQAPLMEALLAVRAHDCPVSVHVSLEDMDLRHTRFVDLRRSYEELAAATHDEVSVVLHGSVADKSFTDFSDVDDLVVLHEAAWRDAATLTVMATRLAALARAYQCMDPFQHHGHWLITDFDLALYDQSRMPLVALKDAVSMVGRRSLLFRAGADASGFVRNALATVASMQRRLEAATGRGSIRAFDLKGLAGEVAILPAYLFQARGLLISKPEAIARAGGLYSDEALEALRWAGLVRSAFSPMLHHWRTRAGLRIANAACSRRDQAEWVMRRASPAAGSNDRLGLGREVVRYLRVFAMESEALVRDAAGRCE